VRGLAALVELSAARRPARLAADGQFVPLASQDTSAWDVDLIDRAHDHLRAAHPARVVGRYQLEAAVQAVHCARRETGRTDWPTLLELHRSLAVVAPSLGSATALAAVTAEVEGPAAGLALLDTDAARTVRFQPAWATRAELLTRLGRNPEAAVAYDHAIALTHETPERRHLEARRAALTR
jgi:predicted RNA polymerase sigma factor